MTAAVSEAPVTSPVESLAMMMRALKLPSFARYAGEIAQKAEREGWTFGQYLHHLAELEIHERRRRRIERYLKDSDLLPEKTLGTLSRARLTPKVAKMLPTLCEGGFVERGDNLLAFGLPGRGKTHLVCAIGYELIQRGYRVLFTATFALVQRLLAAKRDLRLEKELATLDAYDAVILPGTSTRRTRRHRLRAAEPRRDGGALHLPRRTLRASKRDHHQQRRLQRVGSDLQGPHDDGGGDRPPGAPLGDPGDDGDQRPS